MGEWPSDKEKAQVEDHMPSVPIPLTIERLSYGPAGVGRVNGKDGGKVVFVPQTAPGDRVDVVLTKEKKRYAHGHLVAVRQPGPARRMPPCRYVPRCGGCPWQHVTYAEQLRAKEALVREHMRRIGGVEDPPILPIIPSPQEWRYRHRIRLRTEPPARLGFYQSQSHELVELGDCLIAGEDCATHLTHARAWLTRLRTTVRRIELITSDPLRAVTGGVVLIGNAQGRFQADDEEACAAFVARHDDVAGLILFGRGWRRVWGETRIVLDLGVDDLVLEVKRGGFTQVNPAGNRVLIAALLRLSDFKGSQKVIECHTGAGNLSLPIARRVSALIGIEQDPYALADARDNVARTGLDNVTFVHASARVGLQTLAHRKVEADTLVLDPPRAGAADSLDDIPRLRIQKVVYVSCDPTTLAHDLRRLSQLGYRVECLQPIDLFPHTYHVETIAIAVLT